MIIGLLAQAPPQPSELTFANGWPIIPFSALVGGIIVGLVTVVILLIARYADDFHKGFLTVSVLIVIAFIIAVFAAMIYSVPTNPVTEILVGALSTALGAVVSHWVGRYQPPSVSPAEEREDQHVE